MNLILSSALTPSMLLAGTGTLGTGAVADFFQGSVDQFVESQDHCAFLDQVDEGLQQVHELDLHESWSDSQRARLASKLAALNRQLLSFQTDCSTASTGQVRLLQEETETVIATLRDNEVHTSATADEGIWEEVASEYLRIMGETAFEEGSEPLLFGLGAISLGLGARMALKADAALWFANLSGHNLERSARVYLYGHRPHLVEQLNDDHCVPEKTKANGAWVHPEVQGIEWRKCRSQREKSKLQVVGIDSTRFIPVLMEKDYKFFRALPEDAILVSPIKSQIPEEVYRPIYEDFMKACASPRTTCPILRVDGGASMEEIYDMVRYITGREDVRTVHVGGEYFAKNLYFYCEERPRATELVFACKDEEAAKIAARWFRVPGQLDIETTDDVSTVLLGGVMKNIAAYAMGQNDILELEAAFAEGRTIWPEDENPPAGVNGYVDDPRELQGKRRVWWRIFDAIAEDLKGEPVDIPKEILKDFCACTNFNRPLLSRLFRDIRTAYDAARGSDDDADWEAFRQAVINFKEQSEKLANSRNRRGGLLHAMALFIKENLKRPREAKILFLEETIEGYKALRGLRERLRAVATLTKNHLEDAHDAFYTEHGVPSHPELDPLVPKAVRDAVTVGISYESPDGEAYRIPSFQLTDILHRPWLSRPAFEFLQSQIVYLQGHLDEGHTDLRVERDFFLFSRALEYLSDGVAIESATREARSPMPPYHHINLYEGRLNRGYGHPVHLYDIGLKGAHGPERVRDIALLLAHQQSQGEPPEVVIRINVEGMAVNIEETLRAMQSVVTRFRPHQEHPITVALSFKTAGGVVSQEVIAESRPEKPDDWDHNYDESVWNLAIETELPHDELSRYFERHTRMIQEIVRRPGWTALGDLGRGRYSAAFRDALQVAGERAFFGLYNEEVEGYPDEVVVAHFDTEGRLRFFDSKIQSFIVQESEESGTERDWDSFFQGMLIADYLAAYKRFVRKKYPDKYRDSDPEPTIRPLPIEQFPLEEILVEVGREGVRNAGATLAFLHRLRGEAAKEFYRWMEPYYYKKIDEYFFEGLRSKIREIRQSTRTDSEPPLT